MLSLRPYKTPSLGILYAFLDGGRLAWKCYADGRAEYFPACALDMALRTAESLLGLPVQYQETPLGLRLLSGVGGAR